MYKFLTLITVLLLLSSVGFAQEWTVDQTLGSTGQSAQFTAVDEFGKVWVSNYGAPGTPYVRVWDSEGNEASFSPITHGLDSAFTVRALIEVSGIAIHNGIVYVTCDNATLGYKVYRFRTSDGSPLPGWNTHRPGDIAIDGSGRAFLAYKVDARFSVWNASTRTQFKGSPVGPGGFRINRGLGVTADGSTVYYANESNDAVIAYNLTYPAADSVVLASSDTLAQYTTNDNPAACEVDPDGNIWVSLSGANRVDILTPEGDLIQSISGLTGARGSSFDFDNDYAYVAHFSSSVPQATRLVYQELFFSEYVAGTGDNKALEIYNPTSEAIDLANYYIAQSTDGNGWQVFHSFPGESSIASEDVWVIVNRGVNPALYDTLNADEVVGAGSVADFNGDDARALVKIVGTDTMVIDVIGVADQDPGTGWNVAGVLNATANTTLVRKEAVLNGTSDWTEAAGTNSFDSEWIVLPENTLDYLGTHPDSEVEPQFARVQVIHNSADLAAAAVDVYLNDVRLLNDFAFRTASPFVTAPAGVEFDITVAPSTSADSSDGIWRQSYTLAADETYILVASGIVSPSGYSPATPFNIAVYATGREAATQGDETDVLVYHGATDAPAVDVVESSIPAGTLVQNLEYGQFAGYLELGTADYRLDVRDSTGVTTVASFNAPLASLGLDGAAITVFASGFLNPANNSNGPAFGLYAATAGGAVVALPLYQGFVNVEFNVNSSTVEGWTDSTAFMTIRGGIQEVGGPGNDWDQTILKWSNQSVTANNVGGDYWKAAVAFPDSFVGMEVNWKIGAMVISPEGDTVDTWESNPNRIFVLPAVDTVLGLAYVSSGETPPYTPSDLIDVYFRVNMSTNNDFNPETGILSIVGGFPAMDGSPNMWNPGKWRLTREGPSSDYWGFHLRLTQSSDNYPGDVAGRVTEDSVLYRFAIGTDWSNNENLAGKYIPGNENRTTQVYNDTTLAWKYWNDLSPAAAAGQDTVMITFRADMTTARDERGFFIGDTMIVRYGYNFSADFDEDTLVNEFGSNYYSVETEVRQVAAGSQLVYQYYLIKNGEEQREVYYDFNDPRQSTQERRKITLPDPLPASLTVNDDVVSLIDSRRQPRFPNNSELAGNVTVSWECDLRPAYFQVSLGGSTLDDIQGNFDVEPADAESIFVWGVWMNGPAVGGWSNPTGTDWGVALRENLEKKLWDDGTNGDLSAGDSVYTRQTYYSGPDSGDAIGQVYKFGINGGDNEAGGQGYGNNHLANIDDSTPNFTIHTQFGSINPLFYTVWDFDAGTLTDIESEEGIVIRRPDLKGNYPNPFNPATTLTFELPRQMEVSLVIYDVLGRKVRTLLKGMQRPGVHQVVWNGQDDYGRQVSTGIYFYRMNTDNFNKTLKMMLMK